MNIVSRVISRLSARAVPAPSSGLDVIIAERFVLPVSGGHRFQVPGDIDPMHPDRKLAAIIMDESGSCLGHGTLARSAAGAEGRR